MGLDGFPSGAIFLKQTVVHLRVAPSRPRGASSSVVPSSPFSIGVDVAETLSAAADDDVPPPTASDDSDICRTLDHVLTVQAAHGQILVDMLDEIRALRAELAQFRPHPF